jgi:thymidylate synthase (FAD)
MARTLTTAQMQEIADARNSPVATLRPTSPGAEAVIHTPLMLLDHGMLRLVDYMGTDASIPQAARVSYGKGTKAVTDDTALIRYLMRHLHSTPFEMVTAKFHVVCPIFVARQWLRHRSGSFNEYSARYSILEREFYVPEPQHLAAQSLTNKQGRGAVLEGEDAKRVLEILKRDANQAYDDYEWMADEEGAGLARELARINLPVSVYTQFYWSVNLWNLLHFTKLRADGHAQYEIRVYAQAILDRILTPWVPNATQAFLDYRMGATALSRQATALVDAALKGESLAGLERPGKRELDELLAQFPGLARFL